MVMTGYLCYKFEFVDYANIFCIRLNMKVHLWMELEYSSVDKTSSVDGA